MADPCRCDELARAIVRGEQPEDGRCPAHPEVCFCGKPWCPGYSGHLDPAQPETEDRDA